MYISLMCCREMSTVSLKETPVFVLYWNVLINVVKWRPWADKRWNLLPGDEASYCQHQLQTVRLLCILHRVLTEDLSTSLALMRVFIFVQGQLSERMEAVVHPDGFPSLLRCYEAISVEVSAGRLCQPHDAVPRWTIHQQPNTSFALCYRWSKCWSAAALDWQVSPRHVSRI